ncbi:Glutamate--tRNA ligase (Glutamyl-tRNA synthetase) (GluRS) [Durusdinium trenchii]|uniref:glutamate--tRNA ligase n=1 Tax=Durusdinium trenchii TaxID=1381693 RepID=A0ABP0KDS6_9DINO
MAVRVRYAPSPTGSLHLGGLRTALYNYLFAKGADGAFLLRIEDTDQKRLVHGAAEQLERTLARFGMVPDEPVQMQSQRLDLYGRAAEELVRDGHAYPCFCSAERLDAVRQRQARGGSRTAYDRKCRSLAPEEAAARVAHGEAHTVRLKAPLEGATLVRDGIRGVVSFPNNMMDDQVLQKSDGFPTYHLASVVDDHDMDISHVIRGDEWLSSTPKHLTLYEMMGWRTPKFFHLPLLLNKDHSKLSKRNSDASVEALLEASGYEIPAITNFVALLGWSPAHQAHLGHLGGDQDADGQQDLVYPTMDSLVRAFDLSKCSRKGAVVDMDFLHFLNGQHIRRMDRALLARLARQQLAPLDTSAFPDDYVEQAVSLVVERVFHLSDVGETVRHFVTDGADWERDATATTAVLAGHPDPAAVLRAASRALGDLKSWDAATLKTALRGVRTAAQAEAGGAELSVQQVMLLVRWATTGATKGPQLADALALLGRRRVMDRLAQGLQIVSVD